MPLSPVEPEAGIRFSIWHSPHVRGLHVLRTNTHLHSYPSHLHDGMEIFWVRKGAAVVRSRDCDWPVSEGEAGIVPPAELHSAWCPAGRVQFDAILIPRPLLQGIIDDRELLRDGTGQPVGFRVISRQRASLLLPALLDVIYNGRSAAQITEALTPVLAQILEQPSAACGILGRACLHPAVSHAKSFIRDHCVDRVGLEELAGTVNLDMRYFISLFKEATGMTPHQFQIAMRVDRARNFIQQNVELCEVALLTGFSDQSHFSRHFKRHYGLTPGMFREALTSRPNFVL